MVKTEMKDRSMKMPNDVTVLTKENFFRPNENMHIQMSNEFPDYIGIMHTHKYIEVVYIVSGSATHRIAGKTYTVKRGDLFIVNMDTPHAFYEDKMSSEPFVAYDLMFTPEFFDSDIRGDNAIEALGKSFMFHSLFVDREDHPPFYSVSGNTHIIFGELFNKIYLEHRRREKGYIEIIRAYLMQLIITIFRLDSSSARTQDSLRNKRTVDFVVGYLRKNYKSKISVSRLGEMVYLNSDYLGRIFKSAVGCSIGEMIQRLRIEEACRLLSSSDRNIADIAMGCGFEDVKFFYTVFKKHMNMLPSQYRKQTQET